MIPHRLRPLGFLSAAAIVVLLLATAPKHAAAEDDDLLVFISASAAGEKGAIHAYRLDPAVGKLEPLHRTNGVEHPFYMAISPDDKFLYSVHAPGMHGGANNEEIFAYELVGRSGTLKFLNRQSALGSAACYLDVDATSKTLVVANYVTGSVAALPINDDGSLEKAATFIQHEGSSVNAERQGEPHAHAIVVSPDGQFVLSPDLGIDKVLIYRLDAAKSKLTPATPPHIRTSAGAGPRHLTFHPNGRHVYVINELGNTMNMFDYDAATGKLTFRQVIPTLPHQDKDIRSWTADVKATPNGRFLYGTNRGHDTLAYYRIDDKGLLGELHNHPSGGKSPQNLAITPGGELLLCANMASDEVTVFRIDQETGALTQVGESTKLPKPSCILVR